MLQVYYSNTKTNSHTRDIIQKSDLSNTELINLYNVNIKTEILHMIKLRPNKIYFILPHDNWSIFYH
jgi:hypothetical protein